MKRFILAFLLVTTPAWSQAPAPAPKPAPAPAPKPAPAPPVAVLPQAIVTVDHPEPVAPGVLVVIDGSRSIGDDVGWDTDADESVYKVDSGGKTLYFSSPLPGIYRFKLDSYGILSGKIKVSKAKATITVIGADPSPTPIPGPPPGPPTPPPVDPISGTIYATLFYDVNDTSVTGIRVAKTIRDDLAKLDCRWYALATTAPAAQAFNSELAKDGSPVVVFQDASSKILKDRSIKAPKSASEIVAAVQAMRGGK